MAGYTNSPINARWSMVFVRSAIPSMILANFPRFLRERLPCLTARDPDPYTLNCPLMSLVPNVYPFTMMSQSHPVVMTVNARGILAHDHPLAISASASLESVRTLIEQADVVLAIGTEFGPTDYDAYEDGQFKINGTLIRIDLDAQLLLNILVSENINIYRCCLASATP